MSVDGGSHLFAFEDNEVAGVYEQTAHELAFQLAAAAVQEGTPAIDATLRGIMNTLLEGEGASPDLTVLLLTARRLTWFVRQLASTSQHPLGQTLRTHETLTDARIEGAVEMLERYLRDGVL